MRRLSAGGGPGPQLFHLSLRLASRALGGEWGAAPPAEDLPLPEELRVPAGAVTLACLRWPARPPAVDPPRPPLLLLHGLNNNAWSWARAPRWKSSTRQATRPITSATCCWKKTCSSPATT